MNHLACQLLCLALLAGTVAHAAPASPTGDWRTIDDRTGKPRAIIRITERNGAIFGIIHQPLEEHTGPKTCEACTDDRHGQPMLGLEIIRDLRKNGDEWTGGTILDPDTGQVYRCSMALREGASKLAVRGYIGLALFGRTQTWERAD